MLVSPAFTWVNKALPPVVAPLTNTTRQPPEGLLLRPQSLHLVVRVVLSVLAVVPVVPRYSLGLGAAQFILGTPILLPTRGSVVQSRTWDPRVKVVMSAVCLQLLLS